MCTCHPVSVRYADIESNRYSAYLPSSSSVPKAVAPSPSYQPHDEVAVCCSSQ